MIADAGLSMLPTGLTAQGTILSTIPYMAPEQLEEADARTDIVAFGAVLYEMLTGKVVALEQATMAGRSSSDEDARVSTTLKIWRARPELNRRPPA